MEYDIRSLIVSLIGAGPGDPGLITAKGLSLLKHADVVIYDRLVAPELVAKAPRRAKRIYVGKERGKTQQQEHINRILIREARRGRRVVRLKGGDPFVFGRGGEEVLALTQAGIRCEVIPGVTSAFAVPAVAGIPVTHRGLAASVSVFTGHEDPHKRTQSRDWRQAARGRGTLIFLMGVEELPRLVHDLRRAGRFAQTPCAIIQWGTWPAERTVVGTLGTIVATARRARIGPPAIIVVGDVVALRRSGPLAGVRVLVTRPAERAGNFAEQLSSAGAEVVLTPAVALRDTGNRRAINQRLRQLARYQWLLFTSPAGVVRWQTHCRRVPSAARAMRRVRIGVIGPQTAAAVHAAGWRMALVPRRYQQEGLLAALRGRMHRGMRVLIPRAQEARQVLPKQLRRWGAVVDVLPLYVAQPAPGVQRAVAKALRRGPVDVVTFTSSSCVEQFCAALTPALRRQLLRRAVVASIGPITSATARRHGLRVAIQARPSTPSALATVLIRWAQRRSR